MFHHVRICWFLKIFEKQHKIFENIIKEQYIFSEPLSTTCKGEDVFRVVKVFFESHALDWKQLVGICTDGDPSMIGDKSGFKGLVTNVAPHVSFTHCLIHFHYLIQRLGFLMYHLLIVLFKDWGYDDNSPYGECLADWASINCLALLYNAKDAASFYSDRWNTGTNPDLAFAGVGPNSRLPDRRVLDKFPRSQHRPSLITPPRFAMAVPSMPVKRWNFRKAKWSHYIALTNKFAKTLLPPDSLDVDAAYQDFCNTIKKAAKKTIPRGYRNNYIPCWDAECESLYKTFLQSPQGDDSSLAATALFAKLDRKRRD